MAVITTPTPEQEREWTEWVEVRPPHVRDVARKFLPWVLYRMKSTGHRVTIDSFGEHRNGTVTLTVAVTGRFNNVAFGRRVFGIEPSDLEECDLPLPDEVLGESLTQDQVRENMDELRLQIRPDLFERAADGKVVRKTR